MVKQENISMITEPGRILWIGILAFSLISSIALADPAKDLELGEEAFNKEDVQEAIKYFTQAANAGYAPAQVRLGEILDSSEFDKDAVGWFRKAAEQGNADAEYRLGNMYVKGDGVEKNFEKAVYWYNLAARKDNLLAVSTLASAYRKGELGLTIDLDLAKLYDDKAAVLGNAVKKAEAEKAAKKAADKAKKGAEK